MSPGLDDILQDAPREAVLALASAVEPGTLGVSESVIEHGIDATLVRLTRRCRPRAHPPDTTVDIPVMLAECARRGIRVLIPGDAEFPSQLLDLPEPPLALWVRGPLDLRAAALRSVAVVGARACTAYGERATGVVAGGLAEQGWAVISGGAFGIDAAAHRTALAVGGPTVAVLACGMDVTYPRAHGSLFARIADEGLLISELPLGSAPLKHRFLARNRIIAAISRGTVVVEAARRSGAMATASRALELGRVVMAVPGPITSMASSGTNRLLHEGSARAVSDPAEVSGLLVGAPGHLTGESAGDEPGGERRGPDLAGLPEGVRDVLAVLPRRGGRPIEVVAQASGTAPATCLAHLGLLEILGLTRRTPAGWRRTC